MIYTIEDYGLKYKVLIDNINSINLTKNLVHYSRTKHSEIKHHFVRDHIVNGNIDLQNVESKFNIVDILINPLIERII